MGTKPHFKVKGKKTDKPYSTFANGAYFFYQKMQEKEEGKSFYIIGTMLFSAFAMEAYLNHAGKLKIENWDKVEKSFSPKQKIKRIIDELNLDVNLGEPPFQIFHELFQFRKLIVHGKTKIIEHEFVTDRDVTKDFFPIELKSEWEWHTTIENGKRFFEDTQKMMENLHKQIFGLQSSLYVSIDAEATVSVLTANE